MTYLALGLASFVFIFLKAFQQRNVAFNHYLAVIPTSLLMAVVEVFAVATIAAEGWSIGIVLAVGIASGTGAVTAMLTHNRIFNNKDDK